MKKFKSKSLTVMLLSAAILAAILVGVCSCKAWRTVTTTATYVQSSDSAKVTQTISTKTVEEYQGVKKR
jgi:hypothetical protein